MKSVSYIVCMKKMKLLQFRKNDIGLGLVAQGIVVVLLVTIGVCLLWKQKEGENRKIDLEEMVFLEMSGMPFALENVHTEQEQQEQKESYLAYYDILAKEATDEKVEPVEVQLPVIPDLETASKIPVEKLADYDYLIQHFFRIDRTTTMSSKEVNGVALAQQNIKLNIEGQEPVIMIYHTHSQEAYCNSDGTPGTSVVGVGDYLTYLLQEVYHIPVLHHKEAYDINNRDHAYSTALPNITKVIQENPSIQLVIDLHRDGVPEGTRLVTQVQGKDTAKVMFFNGLSRTTQNGDIDYLANPYIQNNLAVALQMQMAAYEYYPGFTRPIYLKGYRYNMHVCKQCMLIEVGAQTNTYEEAKNAMEPLAHLIAKVFL